MIELFKTGQGNINNSVVIFFGKFFMQLLISSIIHFTWSGDS